MVIIIQISVVMVKVITAKINMVIPNKWNRTNMKPLISFYQGVDLSIYLSIYNVGTLTYECIKGELECASSYK